MHGGKSTGGYRGGPIARARVAMTVLRERLRVMGLPWYGGRPRGQRRVRTLVSDAREKLGHDIDALAEVPLLLPQGAAGQQLAEVALKGLRRLEEIIDLPLDQDNPKQMRLVGDMALGVCKLFQRAAEGAFKAQQGNTLVALLEALKEAQARKGTGD